MSNFKDGVFILDKDGTVIYADNSVLKILECDDFTGKNIEKILPDKVIFDLWEKLNSDGLKTQSKEFIPTWLKNKTLSVVLNPYEFLNNESKGVVIIIRDLTSLRRLESLQKDFITNVSHELRTPLTSIKMAAESLQSGTIANEKFKNKFLSNIQRESDRLTRLVNELLVLADVDGKLPTLHLSKFDPVRLFKDVHTTMHYHAELNDIELISHIPDTLPQLEADRDRLSQVLINLVDNAIKCNRPHGSVTVYARTLDDEYLEIKVIDTGIGIPNIDKVRIFERFYRVDKSRSRVTGGTGLGLSLVKDIINAHGGSIDVDSEIDVGTTFIIKVPFKAQIPLPKEDED